jgi:hypothetical protein
VEEQELKAEVKLRYVTLKAGPLKMNRKIPGDRDRRLM